MVFPETLTEIKKPIGLGAQIAETLKIPLLEGEFTEAGSNWESRICRTRFGVSHSPAPRGLPGTLESGAG